MITELEAEAPTALDPVLEERRRWDGMGAREYARFFDNKTGLLNEFQMMWALRHEYPLHYILFRQTACHMSHEGNVMNSSHDS